MSLETRRKKEEQTSTISRGLRRPSADISMERCGSTSDISTACCVCVNAALLVILVGIRSAFCHMMHVMACAVILVILCVQMSELT